jgi:type II secretory pathway pseudopilin PulG
MHRHNSLGDARSKGFTLVELLVLIAITGVLGLTINSLIVNFYRTNAYLLQQTSALDSAHRGLRISFENLRQASYGDDGSYPLSSAATSSIRFYSDIDGNGTVERIRLYLTNGTFYRGVTDSASIPPSYTGQPEKMSTIATYVRNSSTTPLFRFYDTNGSEMTAATVDVSKVTAISITVLVDINPFRAPDILTLTETATLRNIRP